MLLVWTDEGRERGIAAKVDIASRSCVPREAVMSLERFRLAVLRLFFCQGGHGMLSLARSCLFRMIACVAVLLPVCIVVAQIWALSPHPRHRAVTLVFTFVR